MDSSSSASNLIRRWYDITQQDMFLASAPSTSKEKRALSSTKDRAELFSDTKNLTVCLQGLQCEKVPQKRACYRAIFEEMGKHTFQEIIWLVKWAAIHTRHGGFQEGKYVGAYEVFHRLFKEIIKWHHSDNIMNVQALSELKHMNLEILKYVEKALPSNEGVVEQSLVPLKGKKKKIGGLAKQPPLIRHAIFSNLDIESLKRLSKTSSEMKIQVGKYLVHLFNSREIFPKKTGMKSLNQLHKFLGDDLMGEIKNLRCYGCNIENFNWKCCTRLEELELENVSDLGFLKDLCKTLKTLDIYDCDKIKDYTPFQYCTHLEELRLDVTNVSDLGFLKDLPKTLKKLTLVSCRIRCQEVKDFSSLRKCTQLKSLQLGSVNVYDNDLSFLEDLGKTLEEFGLPLCYVKDFTWLRQCTQLKSLNLGGSNVTDKDLNFLKDVGKTLQELALAGCDYIEEVDWLQHCIQLKKLYVWDTKIQDLDLLEELSKIRGFSITK